MVISVFSRVQFGSESASSWYGSTSCSFKRIKREDGAGGERGGGGLVHLQPYRESSIILSISL